MHRNRDLLFAYIELTVLDYEHLKLLQTEVLTELIRLKLNVDKLILRRQQGFIGEEYKVTRQELLKNLDENTVWKSPENAHREYMKLPYF